MNKSHFKVGTYTSVFLVLSTGAALLGHWFGFHSIAWLMKGSPAFLILLGCEYLFSANKGDRITLAWGKIITALVISVVITIAVLGVTWFFGDAEAKSLPHTEQMISSDIRGLDIDNINGSVTLLAHAERTIKIETDVKHPFFDMYRGDIEVEAYEEDETFYIATVTPSFRFIFIHTRPSVDLTVYVPEDHPLAIKIEQKNGKIKAQSLSLLDTFRAQTTNGSIEVESMEGKFRLTSTNGRITATDVQGTVEARSTNGKINIDGDIGRIVARTTNGSITAASSIVNDDWDLQTTNGNLTLTLPSDASIDVSARTTNGAITAPDSFEIDGKRITGKLGSGKYDVEVRTTNGRLTISTP